MDSSPNSDSAWRVFFSALWTCRVPLSSSVLALLMFLFLPQARDLFVEIKGLPMSGIAFWVGFFVFAIFAWLVPVYFASRLALETEGERIGLGPTSRYEWMRFAIPAGLVLVCLTSIILGNKYSYKYLVSSKHENVGNLARDHLQNLQSVTFVMALAFGVFILLSAKRAFRKRDHGANIDTALPLSRFAKFLTRGAQPSVDMITALAVLLIFSVLAFLLWFVSPLDLAAMFPRAQLVPLILGFWVGPLTLLGLVARRIRFPLIFVSLLGCVGLDTIYDKHTVHIVEAKGEGGKYRERMNLAEAIEAWRLANGCDAEVPGVTCRRPIIVAASGGASRAAFFTASVLGLIEDLSRNSNGKFNKLSNQLFAISSVSGSSLGAASYLALHDVIEVSGNADALKASRQNAQADGLWFANGEISAAGPESATPWKDALQIYLSGDFLTPVIAGWTFRDIGGLGSFFGQDDRARILERAWEKRFLRVFGLPANANPMTRPLIAYAPSRQRWRPVLFLNGSMVETGRRIVASPVAPPLKGYDCRFDCDFDPRKPDDLTEFYTDAYDLHDLINGATAYKQERNLLEERLIKSDVLLSTAALLSARFPGISPHGTLTNHRLTEAKKRSTVAHIVDGGYFENNGALTVVDLIDAWRVLATAADPTAGHKKSCYYPANSKAMCTPEDRAAVCKPGDTKCSQLAAKIQPLIIQISNDPGTQACPAVGEVDPARRLALPVSNSWRMFPSMMYVIDTVLGAREARGSHASELLSYVLDDDREGYFAAYDTRRRGFVHFRVCPQFVNGTKPSSSGVNAKLLRFNDVSMSWWLSKPVQSYLDDQLCNPHNQIALVKVLMALSADAAKAWDDDATLEGLRLEYTTIVSNKCGTLKRVNETATDSLKSGGEKR